MNSMGIAYDEIKDYENAERYYLKCIELNPRYHNPYYNLGYLYNNKKLVDKAV
jgi:tetratricopeptide (TPR) repeat protein